MSLVTPRTLITLLIGTLVPGALMHASAPQENEIIDPTAFPLSSWSSQKEVTQIPWTVTIGKTSPRFDLRQEFTAAARFTPKERDADSHEFVMFARVSEHGKTISPVHQVTRDAPLFFKPSRLNARMFLMVAVARPGTYRLELALLDRTTGRHNTQFRTISIEDSDDARFAEAFRDLPRFEFAPQMKPEERELSVGFSLPSLGRGMSLSSLTLSPVRFNASQWGSSNAAPTFVMGKSGITHVSLLSTLSPPDRALDSPWLLDTFQQDLGRFLFVFTRLKVLQGTARFTGLDLMDGTRVFDQVDLGKITSEQVHRELFKDRTTVSLDAMVGRAHSGALFRQALKDRLEEAENDTSGANHVVIVVNARSKFPDEATLKPLQSSQPCHCRVFYVRFALMPNETDDIPKLLKSYRPQIFEPLSWKEFREDFARIYERLRQ
jgi:hypothetical protein